MRCMHPLSIGYNTIGKIVALNISVESDRIVLVYDVQTRQSAQSKIAWGQSPTVGGNRRLTMTE